MPDSADTGGLPERKDKTITCVDCKASFTFRVAEQIRFESRGLQEPKRCPSCRDAKRQANRSQGN